VLHAQVPIIKAYAVKFGLDGLGAGVVSIDCAKTAELDNANKATSEATKRFLMKLTFHQSVNPLSASFPRREHAKHCRLREFLRIPPYSSIMRIFFAAFFIILASFFADAAAPAHAATETFTSAGTTLAYHAYGQGPIVIVLNGGPGLNGLYMEPVARKIAAFGYRAILLDQRGTGSSVAAGSARTLLTVAGTVADIEALRVALHQDKLVFVTHSFGGAMALAYAAAYPQHVAKMILSGSVGTDLSTVGLFGKRLDARLTPAERKERDAAVKRNDDTTQLNIQILTEFDDQNKARKTIAALPHPLIYPVVSAAIYNDFDKHYHVASALRAYHGSVTLLTGADDAAMEMEPSLRATFPHATLVPVPNSGHWPWVENPAVFDRALKTALAA
jgi:proline iminopeptidase